MSRQNRSGIEVSASPVLSDSQTLLCLISLLIAPLACAGLALINAGLGRARSAAHTMTAALCVMAVAACVYVICGRSWQGFSGEASRTFFISGKPWDWLGAATPFLAGLSFDGSPALLAAWMGMISAGLTGLIPLGTGSERWRLSAICVSTAVLAGFTFPLFAHWAWGGGWLVQLGNNYGLGMGYVDVGGSGTIHVAGGLTALSLAWLLGPRKGKFGYDGMPMAIPGHNAVYIVFGCFLALVGWTGLNAAGALLFAGVQPGRVALIAVNTILSAASAGLAAAAITRVRFGKPDSSLTANGWIGGLVAVSATCAFLPPAAAILIGLAAGAMVAVCVELFELHLDIDDPGGSISVHAVAGIWGLLAGGALGRFPGGRDGQLLAQAIGVATLIGFVLPMTYGVNWLLNRFVGLRIAPDAERQGMDLAELGAGAYPEFVTHTDDSMQR
jgi:Amt family ammonium transporter